MTTNSERREGESVVTYTVKCDAKECDASVEATGNTLYDAWEAAAGKGWSINECVRVTWVYCPRHRKQYEGHTPSGRALLQVQIWDLTFDS